MPQAISLYIHIPFCAAKCAYCNFNSYAGLEHLHEDYVQALAQEIAEAGRRLPSLWVRTIYLGGGTPTILSLGALESIFNACHAAFPLHEGAEVTCEANPGTVDPSYLQGLRRLGVGRLSLGMQSLRDAELALLGRIHRATEGMASYQMACRAGFENINLDLIYALPYQTLENWRSTLEGVLTLQPEHLSLYPLSLEEGMPLWKRVRRGETPAPDPDLAAEMYTLAQDLLEGYTHYEISNWAKPGYECRHNLCYWRNEEYLGFGAGAHSHYGGRRYWNVRRPEEYIGRLRGERSPVEGEERIDTPLEVAETVFMGLRLDEGVRFQDFRRRFGRDLVAVYGSQLRELARWGLLEVGEDGIRLTPRGRLLGNEVFERFLPPNTVSR